MFLIREYTGSKYIKVPKVVGCGFNLTEAANHKNYKSTIKKGHIIQIIEGIHAGPTSNFTWYTANCLKKSVESWTKPYNKPLILHHNEKDGVTIGRIINVEYITTDTRSGTPALIFTCHVSDLSAIEQIKDGRFVTVSIGGLVNEARCSICGKEIEIDENDESLCGHNKGQVYDNKTCYWMIEDMTAKELSYVNVPADMYAHNLETIDADEYLKRQEAKGFKINEGIDNDMKFKITESEDLKVKENSLKGKAIDEELKAEKIEPAKKEEKEEVKAETPKEPEVEKTEEPVEKEAKEEPKVDERDEKIKDLETKLEEANKIIEETKATLKKAIADLDSKEVELKAEVELKESIETQVIDLKMQLRESIESEVINLRKALNKSVIAKESLAARSEESLKDSILDLKEELNSNESLKLTESIKNPLNSEKNKNIKESTVKEKKSNGNINVEESLDISKEFEGIFSNLFNGAKY